MIWLVAAELLMRVVGAVFRHPGPVAGIQREGRWAMIVRRLRWSAVGLLLLLTCWWLGSTVGDIVVGEEAGAVVGVAVLVVFAPVLAVLVAVLIPPAPRRLEAVVEALVLGRVGRLPRLLRRWREGDIAYTSWEMPVGVTLALLQRSREVWEQGLNCGIDVWYRDGAYYIRACTGQIPEAVSFAEFYRERRAGELPFGVGMSRTGRVWADLADLPHLLIGGVTGGGKSAFLRQMVTWLALTNPPERLRLGLVDLKGGMELGLFSRLPHRLANVACDLEAADELLRELDAERERRQAAFAGAGVVSLREWNQRYPGHALPHLVLVVDEMAELTAAESSGREERARHQARLASFSRLLRLGRAPGVLVVVATQRPDADAVPGQLKANLPATVAFRVRDEVNSRILLGDGNPAAAGLPALPGRVIWQWDVETQAQTPWIGAAEAAGYLEGLTLAPGEGTEPVTQCPQPPALGGGVRC